MIFLIINQDGPKSKIFPLLHCIVGCYHVLMLKLFIITSLLVMNSAWSFTCKPQYDSLGIPHETSSSLPEMYYCFGYHHGKDRAWEMDFLRRVAQGRNAEHLGFAHLKSDLMMRLLNLPERAKNLWDAFAPEERVFFQHYVDGVNAGFQIGKEAKEFKDLGYEPEAWTPQDSLTLLFTQSFDQTRKTFFKDYQEEKSKEDWGDKAAALFDHDGMPWENTILKNGEYLKKAASKTSQIRAQEKVKLWAPFPTIFGEESGSNNWVVSAKNSKTGKAILANDPHLDLKTPLFWYWLHLKSPEGEWIGASLPGVPVIATGTNGKVSWGLTNAYINTADVIFIKDPDESQFETIRPTVWVKFGPFKLPFFFKSFQRLKSTGQPILPLELKRDDKMVVRWTGFSITPKDVLPIFDFLKAKNVVELDEVLKRFNIPAWNFVFADRKGDIGFRLVGKSYKHTEKLPWGIPMESMDEFLKEEYLDPMEKPHVLKPARGYIYTANNRHWPQDSAFYGGRGYTMAFRGYRIDELLQGKHDPESFKAIQCDTQVVDAKFFLPKLLKYVSSPELSNWDLAASDTSVPLSLYRRLMDISMEEWKVDEYALYRLLDNLSEDQKKDLKKFFERTKQDVQNRGWGEFHRLGFKHLSNDERWVFSPEIAGVGDNHTVNPGTSSWLPDKKIYQQFSGASMRMIIEMTDRPQIQLVLPGLNRDYSNNGKETPWQDWKNCKYTKVTF